MLVGQPDEDGVDIVDHHGEARRAYQIRHDMLVLVRPDGYCAFTGEPTGESAVQDYLSRFHRQKP
ncbi:MAG TPA: hypothetical protein VGD73_19765 [Pseudonocardia sp.]|uniref:hypothetical protein n=1 Tax=Pseudonocardia sp. TaxID=60912 RepID=UPI002ED88406